MRSTMKIHWWLTVFRGKMLISEWEQPLIMRRENWILSCIRIPDVPESPVSEGSFGYFADDV